jgi:hypothetical protein
VKAISTPSVSKLTFREVKLLGADVESDGAERVVEGRKASARTEWARGEVEIGVGDLGGERQMSKNRRVRRSNGDHEKGVAKTYALKSSRALFSLPSLYRNLLSTCTHRNITSLLKTYFVPFSTTLPSCSEHSCPWR